MRHKKFHKTLFIFISLSIALTSCENQIKNYIDKSIENQLENQNLSSENSDGSYEKNSNTKLKKFHAESYTSSSNMKPANGYFYTSDLAGDENMETWWSPEVKINCWLQINSNTTGLVNHIMIHGGAHKPNYKAYGNLYLKNLRIESLKIMFSDGSSEMLFLNDIDEIQKLKFKTRKTNFIRIIPKSFYPTVKWPDICISYFKSGYEKNSSE